MKHVFEVTVEAECVDDLGHLNHALGLRYLEYARDDWYRAAGLWDGRPWSDKEHLSSIILNVNFNYRAECFLDEKLHVVTKPVSRGQKSFVLAQQLIKADGSIAVEGNSTSLIMNLRTRETLPIPESLARYFSQNG